MDIQLRLKEGEALFMDGQIAKAEAIFQDIILSRPDHPDALNNLGVLCHSRGDIQKAEQFFLKALEVHGEYTDALSNLVDLYESTGQWQKASSAIKSLIALRGGDHNLQERLKHLDADSGATELRSNLNSQEKQVNKRAANSCCSVGIFPKPGSLRASFLEVNITPAIMPTNPVYLQGMAGGQRKATSISIPLMMQILLIEDAHFTKILLVTADLFGFGNEMVSLVREMAAPWGIPPEGILLNASHTHYAPGTVSHVSSELGPYHAQYATAIASKIGESLDVLYNNLEECEIGLGYAELQIGINRRLPDKNTVLFAPNNNAFYDSFTPFLHIDLKGSQKKLVLINHGCHPTGLGNMPIVSADFVGYMRESLRMCGAADSVMFFQGGAGSSKEAAFSGNGRSAFSQSLDDVKKNGTYMAEKIASALKSPMVAVGGDIFCTSTTAYLPLKNQPSYDTLRQLSQKADSPPVMREWAIKSLEILNQGLYPSSIPMELQMISIGKEVRLIGIPGEPVSELAIKLREASSTPEGTMVLGYTNGLLGYLPTDTMIEEGGYEPQDSSFYYLLPSQLDLGTETKIMKAFHSCSKKTNLKEEPSGYGRHHLNKNPKRAFFALSAGRCGTMTLAKLLSLAENARVLHHPRPYLINETLLAYRGKIDKTHTFWKARSSVIQRTWTDGLIHGETDHNITPFCEMLATELPMAKFLVLVRDPKDFIRSGMRRNYYQGHEWDTGRLRPEEHNPEYQRWTGMDPFLKICWLWSQTYTYIQQTVEAIGDGRVLLVRFEDLVSSTEKTQEIFDFLELTGFSARQIKEVLALRLNEQKGPDFPKPKDWPDAWNEALRRECDAVARKYGYELDQVKTPTMENGQASAQKTYNVSPVNHVPQVGVGLSVYGGDLLERAIASVLGQDFKDLELVVLDLGRDPHTRKICNNFQKTDSRLRYVNSGEDRNYVGKDSFVRVINLTDSRYFMWASYDDLHHPGFLSKAVERLDKDSDTALVYFLTQAENAQGMPIPSRTDIVKAEMEDPFERFSHVIWNLDLCNAFHGLFRREMLVKCKAFRQHLYRAYDNLLLAEIALYGKIIQLDEILFTRRMTCPRSKYFEKNNADAIREWDPSALDDGITFPMCRLTYAHCELIAQYAANREQRNRLVQEIVTCFRKRFGPRLRSEIQRILDLIGQNVLYRTWDGREEEPLVTTGYDPVARLHLSSLLAGMQEACFLYPDWPELIQTYQECQIRMSNLPAAAISQICEKMEIEK